MKGKAMWLGVLLLAWAFAAPAGVKEVRKQIEASMLVTGHILVEADGSVSGVEMDQADKLPKGVTNLVAQASGTWKFEPIVLDGVARKARARMSLRVVAKKLDDGRYELFLRGAHFGKEALSAEEQQAQAGAESIRSVQLSPPNYPDAAAQMGARGTVYLILKIGADGAVQDAIAEQVNLQVLGKEHEMEQMRTLLSKSALSASKRWKFQPPTEGALADDGVWLVRVPVDYKFHGQKTVGYGEWDAYVPGPRQQAPWASDGTGDNEGNDAIVAGGIYPVGQGLRLLTPLQSG